MRNQLLTLLAFLCVVALVLPRSATAQLTVAQITDSHLGEPRAPQAAENLRRIVEMVNARRPDVVVLTGDIGENPTDWMETRDILRGLNAPLHYVPGNHDVHSNDVARYRSMFGPDYYRFNVKNVTFIVIDSQLLGNFDQYDATEPPPLSPEAQYESDRMLDWLAHDAGKHRKKIVIGLQHVPIARAGDFPPDPKPYWVISEPYRSREIELLHQLHIRHMLVGHWHRGMTFDNGGIVWHVGPSSAWLPWGGELGFALHTVSKDGDVQTEFVRLTP
jgi:3',5'-cyclic AMP phosphodiesterase CpdA